MNIQENKIFSKYTTNFKARINRYPGDVKIFGEFDGMLIKNDFSIKCDKLMFTNFLSKYGNKKQKDFLSQIKQDSIDKNVLLNKFDIDILREINKKECARLISIVNTYGESISKIGDLIKCKYKAEKSCQLYVKINHVDNIVEVVLIDVHHLGLPADRKVGNRILHKDLQKQYDAVKNCQQDIADFLKQA